MRLMLLGVLGALGCGPAHAAELPIFDAHIHYSHDAVDVLPPKDAIAILRQAGVRRALVSSSDDAGTQQLLAEAPDLIVPELRPYRRRGDLATWTRDSSVLAYIEERLKAHRYVGIGEFHAYGAEVEAPVARRVIELARQYRLFLHAHSDAAAIDGIFGQNPAARVLWAHAGFARADEVGRMLERHATLWCDLAFRNDHARAGKVAPEWRALFERFPQRFMLGTDTFTPERWHYVGEHARWSRKWLEDLPAELGERIAYKNAEALIGPWPGG